MVTILSDHLWFLDPPQDEELPLPEIVCVRTAAAASLNWDQLYVMFLRIHHMHLRTYMPCMYLSEYSSII